ncbi:MAG TPA: UDP-3-O-(3-hydroxymyristoyl)glucosamine N-acyltransferase [Armatimonadota bacterium]|nr:UDP-3-O-(3-hydroxymyristoyl)glucosamine N-acyltransferase [Armatimonadota bacterium]
MTKTLGEIAAVLGGVLEGDAETLVGGVAGFEDASAGDILFIENQRYAERAAKTKAAAVITPEGVSVPGKPVVHVPEPRAAFVQVLELFQDATKLAPGVADTAVLGSDLSLGEGVHIGDFCHIGNNVRIGEGAVIYPFVYLDDNVSIGPGAVLFPHVTVYREVQIGARVRIHAGAVLGADGFGYLPIAGEHHKIPHLGTVVIEDDVEIGACTCIDRAKTAETRVGRGTKIDNLVQVGHNVRMGNHCILVSQSGLAGSVTLGDYVIIGGQTGVNPHVTIGDGTCVGGRSGVMGNLPGGLTVAGYPARPHQEHLRVLSATLHLPEMQQTVRALTEQIEALTKRVAELEAADEEKTE